MRFLNLLTMSVNNLRRRKLRTFLTVLGVVIGTASIVVMVSLGIGLNNFTMETIKSSGSLTAIEIYNYQGMQGDDKTEEDFITDETIKSFSQIPHVTSVYPILNINVLMKQGIYEGYVTMMGVPLDYMKDIPLGAGKLPSPNADMLEMVVGNMVARNFTNSKTGKGYWDTGEGSGCRFYGPAGVCHLRYGRLLPVAVRRRGRGGACEASEKIYAEYGRPGRGRSGGL